MFWWYIGVCSLSLSPFILWHFASTKIIYSYEKGRKISWHSILSMSAWEERKKPRSRRCWINQNIQNVVGKLVHGNQTVTICKTKPTNLTKTLATTKGIGTKKISFYLHHFSLNIHNRKKNRRMIKQSITLILHCQIIFRFTQMQYSRVWTDM